MQTWSIERGRFSAAFLVSLLLHLLTGGYFVWQGYRAAKEWHASDAFGTRPGESLKVQPLSEAQLKERLRRALDKRVQVVQVDERLKSAQTPTRSARLSKVDQAVDRETRAARVEKFKNVLREGSEVKSKAEKLLRLADPQQSFDKSATGQKSEESAKVTNGSGRLITPGHGRKPASLPSMEAGAEGDGYSATDDYLPDVAIGTQTLLNAREFKFYSFFEHIRRKLTDRWHDRLNKEFDELRYKGRKDLTGEKTTQVKVLLDARGQLRAVNVVGSSGVTELDRAAQEAFRAAAPFPNPPNEMMEGDTVTVRWDFVVVADETSGLRVKVRGYGP